MTPEYSSFRLLVLLDQLQPIGLVRQLLELLERLPRREVVVRVVCVARRGSDPEPLATAMDRRGIPLDVVWEKRRFDPGPLVDIRRIMHEWKPDILETHGYKSAAYALGLCRGRWPRWVAFYHGRTRTSWAVRAYHQFERWAMSRADVIATASAGVAGHLRARDRGRLMVVPNGVVPLAPARRSRSKVRTELGFREQDVVLGFVGRLSFEKGPDVFSELVEKLHAKHRLVRGLVLGDGSMKDELSARTRESGDDLVKFIGHVDGMAEMYAAMDTLVIPSRSEVFPNVLLEAVDAEVPVAATSVGGIPGIAEGLSSVVVAEGPSGLPAAVEEALRSSDDAVRRTKEILHERFSQERRVECAMEVYCAALKGLDRV